MKKNIEKAESVYVRFGCICAIQDSIDAKFIFSMLSCDYCNWPPEYSSSTQRAAWRLRLSKHEAISFSMPMPSQAK